MVDLGGVVGEAVLPDEIEVVLELLLGLVHPALDLLEHGLEVHGVLDDCEAEIEQTEEIAVE